MPTVNDFGPAVNAHDGDAIRNALVKRVIYAIADDEDPTDFVANTQGQVSLGLAYGGGVFWLDPNDLSSTHDGVTVIVTSDGYRYRISDFRMPRSVLRANLSTPPASPSIGDAYFTSAAPTGDWANNPEEVAVWTSRGWVFVAPQVGEQIYVADGSQRWLYLDETGALVERSGNTPSSIVDQTLVGGQRRFIVENQTTDTPPASPALGMYWIVGPVPTGAWAGQTGNIATSYDGGLSWAFIPAVSGLEAFDRQEFSNFIYRPGAGWVSAAGAWTKFLHVYTEGTGSTTSEGSTPWNGSASPTTGIVHRLDGATLTLQANRVGALLRFRYSANVEIPLSSVSENYLGVVLFRDSESQSLIHRRVGSTLHRLSIGGNFVTFVDWDVAAEFVLTASDTASHTYRAALLCSGFGSALMGPVSLSKRLFTLEESL